MPDLLTILLDRDDLDCIEQGFEEALQGTLVAFDVDIHLHLQRRRQRHLTVWDVVDRTDAAAITELEAQAVEFWTAHARADFEGLDLLQMTGYRHKVCYGRLAWACVAVGKILSVLRPTEVVVFAERSGHGLDQPPPHGKMPLLFALLRGLAEQAGIATRVLERPQGHGAFVDWTARVGQASLPPSSPVAVPEPYILFYGYDSEVLRHQPLVDALRREAQVLQVYKWASPATLERMASLDPPAVHESQLLQAPPDVDVGDLGRTARREFDLACERAPAALHGIFANRHMNVHFDFMFGEYLHKMAGHVRRWRHFFVRHRPAVLCMNTPFPIYDVAVDLGVPALALPHGLTILGQPKVMLSLVRSHVTALGSPHRRRLLAGGVPSKHIHDVGDPHLDALLDHSEAETPLGQTAAVNPRRRVLLLTANMGRPAGYHGLPLTDWRCACRCLRALPDLVRSHPQWELTVKCHPRCDHPGLYERVNEDLPRTQRIRIVAGGDLEEWVRRSDVVVVSHTITSGLIEASLQGRPVLIWDEAMMWYDRHEWHTAGWTHVGSLRDLEAELKNLLSDPTSYAAGVRRTRHAVEAYLGAAPTPAVPRCVALIRRLARAGTQSRKCAGERPMAAG